MKNHLTGRVGVQIKAVLSSLHGEGFNLSGLEQQAENAMRRGQAPAAAYERAVGDFVRANPTMKQAVERVARLVQRSDDATVAAYDKALDAYIAGDDAPLQAMAPTIRSDMQALAVRDGDLSVDDAAVGRVDWAAMGLPGLADVGSAGPAQAAAPQQFAFAASGASDALASSRAPQEAAGRTAPSSAWSNQVGATASPTGIRTGAAAERWARAERVTEGQAAPLVGKHAVEGPSLAS